MSKIEKIRKITEARAKERAAKFQEAASEAASEIPQTRDDIRKAVEAKRQKLLKKFGEKPPSGGGSGKVDSKFIEECLNANELGDGILYAMLHEGKYIYNKSSKEWLRWAGHHWEIDVMDSALAAVENVCNEYLKEALNIVQKIASTSKSDEAEAKQRISQLEKTQKRIYKRVYSLRADARRNSCLKFAHSNSVKPLAIKGNELDQDPWLLPCANGVVDLKTGELRPGRPQDYMLKASPIKWKGINQLAPTWEQALFEIFDGDESIIKYLQRLLGYAVTGLTREHVFPILHGKGRNGKSTIVDAICHVLGPLAGPIPAEMLLDQGKVRSSAGPSPDIADLQGLRIAFASETDRGRRFSLSRVKWLVGGDMLVARLPHDKRPVRFRPTHTLFLLTNNLPSVNSGDFAFWQRVHCVPFKMAFVDRTPQKDNERRADKLLPEKLQAEASGILAWLVRGCIEWQERGLDPPEVIRKKTEEYRDDEDLLGQWIEECCHLDAEAETPAKELYESFRTWWEEQVSEKHIPSPKKFGQLMAERVERKKSDRIFYKGIRLLKTWEHGRKDT